MDGACVFCQIIAGDLPSHTVYENESVLAIMDLRQANPGHVLVIPKLHVPMIYELPADIGADIMACVIEMSKAVKDAFDAEGMSIWQSNGECAGQEVPHVHFHVHPRKPGDGLLRVYPERLVNPSQGVLMEYADRIRLRIP